MVQGTKKLSRNNNPKAKKAANSAKVVKQQQRVKQVKKGNPLQLPRRPGVFRNEALDDRDLSKAIAKASEQKVAAKLLQAGGQTSLKDVSEKGKELNVEKNRARLKKKLGRVEEKLKELEAKESKDTS